MPKDVEDVFHAGIGGHRRVADGDTYLAAGGYVGDRYLQCEGFGIIPAIRIDGCAVGLYGYVAVGNASEQEIPCSPGRQSVNVSLGWRYRECGCGAVLAPSIGDRGGRRGDLPRVMSRILHQREVAVRSGEDDDLQMLRVVDGVDGIPLGQGLHRHDAAGLREHGNSVERTPDGHAPSVGRRRAIPAPGEEVEPVALRQPYVGLAPSGGFIHRFRDGRGQQFGAEHVFVGNVVCGVDVGRSPIHGLHQGKACPGCAPVHGVEVRNHAMAQAERIVHDRTEGLRMFFWTVRRPVQDFCGIARGSSSPVTS